ncbi:MAG: hypothetical protein K2X29_08715, partial [Candidatus Obscuribacterales bacterium]|nr:hypothetical protein [Candidatus Obscuribacterales bacterium]
MDNSKLQKLVSGISEALGADVTVETAYASNDYDGCESEIVVVKTVDVEAVQKAIKDARVLLQMKFAITDTQKPSAGPILATLSGQDFVEKYLSGYFTDAWETPEFKVRNRGESMQVVTD